MKNNNKQNPLFRLFKLTIWIIVIYIIYNIWSYSNFKEEALITKEQIIEIKKGDNFINLADKIDWINKTYLKFYLKKNTPNFELKVWNYKIREKANIEEILIDLSKKAIIDETTLTLLEWWNIYDIDEYLTKNLDTEVWEYIKYVENPEKIEELKLLYPFIWDVKTLEWFLYPDTYRIKKPLKINEIVIKQLDNFEDKVYSKILVDLQKEDIEDLIILSSIVEKEERNVKEKSTVAWILKKRLNEDWNIWADITVCYPHKLTAEKCKLVVSKYINEKSDYNTRTMKWLPKTPIWNPSYETINATLNDKKTAYWYYLHNSSTWKIYYAETNEDHEYNKENYMR